MFVLYATALLCFLSSSQSAPAAPLTYLLPRLPGDEVGSMINYSTPNALCNISCLVSTVIRESTDLYLLRKVEGGREVEEEEMDEYRGQVESLGLPLPVVMEPGKALCGYYVFRLIWIEEEAGSM
ncbi:unnamed protein product [Coregonus sp. 'balchen']|nr:unnamed protein product [Coregonus sp. 'balchen']